MSTDRRNRGKVDGPAPPRPSQARVRHGRDANGIVRQWEEPIAAPPTPVVRRYPQVSDGPDCPTGGKAHGKMYRLATKWYCPSSGHNGLPVTAKDGPREPTQHSFTDEEVITSQESR